MSFSEYKPTKRARRNYWFVGLILVALLLVGGVIVIRKTYANNLKPVSQSKTSHVITIEPGSTPSAISSTLLAKGVIRSDWAFEWYVRNHQVGDKLKAGTFVIYENQSVEEIVNTIIGGKVATDLVTILPGQRLAQVREALIGAGFTAADVDAALEPTQYASHPALTDKPANANLEGYLYPESFQKTADTTASQVVKQSLDEMQRRLTTERREAFSKEGLTVHQAITIASIVEQEVSNSSDRAQAAQVFIKRYNSNIMLGSDVTAFYGARLNGQEPTVGYDTPYNTRLHAGLPPGPISNVTESSLDAVAYPAQTDWLFFVAGDDGKTYFSKTNEEHEALTKKYCIKLCS